MSYRWTVFCFVVSKWKTTSVSLSRTQSWPWRLAHSKTLSITHSVSSLSHFSCRVVVVVVCIKPCDMFFFSLKHVNTHTKGWVRSVLFQYHRASAEASVCRCVRARYSFSLAFITTLSLTRMQHHFKRLTSLQARAKLPHTFCGPFLASNISFSNFHFLSKALSVQVHVPRPTADDRASPAPSPRASPAPPPRASPAPSWEKKEKKEKKEDRALLPPKAPLLPEPRDSAEVSDWSRACHFVHRSLKVWHVNSNCLSPSLTQLSWAPGGGVFHHHQPCRRCPPQSG